MRYKHEQLTIRGYCFKCRQRREIQKAQEIMLGNGKPAVSGICTKCGGIIIRAGKMNK